MKRPRATYRLLSLSLLLKTSKPYTWQTYFSHINVFIYELFRGERLKTPTKTSPWEQTWQRMVTRGSHTVVYYSTVLHNELFHYIRYVNPFCLLNRVLDCFLFSRICLKIMQVIYGTKFEIFSHFFWHNYS